MLKLLFTSALLIGAFHTYGQGVLISNDGSLQPDSSAILHLNSINKGLLIPRLTSAQMNAISGPLTGLLVYQKDGIAGFYYNSGTSGSPVWTALLGASTGIQLAPTTQQSATTINKLINIKLNGTTTLGTSGTSDLLSLSANGTYTTGPFNQEWFRVDNAGGILAQGTWDGVNDVVGSGTIPTTGDGTRLMWYPAKGAFRAGYTNGGNWDDTNIGDGSFAVGARNRASGLESFAFGQDNTAGGRTSGAFGENNSVTAHDSYAFGQNNNIAANNCFIQGTSNTMTNTAGTGSTALGILHTISATTSFAIGERATVAHNRALVISLGPSFGIATNDAGANTLTVRATNGIYLGTNTGSPVITAGHFIETSTGAFLTSGGSWTNSSDRNLKENFIAVDGEEVLVKLRSMPITTWNYRKESTKTRHLGPMAQDFAAAFHLGDSNKSISTVDEGGVALAGIKALDQRSTKQQTIIENLQQENEELRRRMEKLERMVLNTGKQQTQLVGKIKSGRH